MIADVLWAIWFSRNQSRYQNRTIDYQSYFNDYNLYLMFPFWELIVEKMSHSDSDLSVMWSFEVTGQPLAHKKLSRLIGIPPPSHIIIYNTYDATKGCLVLSACSGNFIDRCATTLGCFTRNHLRMFYGS